MPFYLQFNLKRGGQRVATMLMYLTDNVEGGETFFPMVNAFQTYKPNLFCYIKVLYIYVYSYEMFHDLATKYINSLD